MSRARPLEEGPLTLTQCGRCKRSFWLGPLQRTARERREGECPRCLYNRICSDPEPPGRQTALEVEGVQREVLNEA